MKCQDAATQLHKDLKLYYFQRLYDILQIQAHTPTKLVEIQLPLPYARDAGSIG